MRHPLTRLAATLSSAFLLSLLLAAPVRAQDTRIEISAPDAPGSVTLADDGQWTSFFQTLDIVVDPGPDWRGVRQLQLVVTGKRGERYFSPTVTSRVMVNAAEASRDTPLSGGRFVGPSVVSSEGIWGAWSGETGLTPSHVRADGTDWRPGSAWIPGAAGGPGNRWIPEELSSAEGVRDASGGVFVYAVFADVPAAEQPVVRPLALTAGGGGGPVLMDPDVVGAEARYDVGGAERYADDPVAETYEGSVYPEAGRISPLADDWRTVDLEQLFEDPVVIAGPPTHQGSNPGVLRVRSVGQDGFEARFREWEYRRTDHDDTRHADETAHYLVIESGPSQMVDDSRWIAGTFELDGTRSWTSVSFDERLPGEPRIFLTPQTANGDHPVSVRARNVTAEGFEAAFFEEEALDDGHVTETVGYLAVYSDDGSGTATVNRSEVDYSLRNVALTDEWKRVGPERLHLEEESSNDSETEHVEERVDVLLLGPPASDRLFAQQVTNHGSDPAALRKTGLEETAESPSAEETGQGQSRTAVIGLSSFTISVPLDNNGDDPAVFTVAYRGKAGQTASVFRTSHTTRNLPHATADTYIYRVGGDAPGDTYVKLELEPWEVGGVCFVFFERDNSTWSDVENGVYQAIQDSEEELQDRMGSIGSPDFDDTSQQNREFIARASMDAVEQAIEVFNPYDYRHYWRKTFKNTDDYMGTTCAHTVNVPGLSQDRIAQISESVFHGSQEAYVIGGSKRVWLFPIFKNREPEHSVDRNGRWDMNLEVHLGLEAWKQAGYPFDATY